MRVCTGICIHPTATPLGDNDHTHANAHLHSLHESTRQNKNLVCAAAILSSQFAFFDFRMGNGVVHARVEAEKQMQKVWIARVEVAKVAQQIGLSQNCDIHRMLYCSLACLRVEPFK